jgi:hypothetical protein
MTTKLQADFNGLFRTKDGSTLLCLSHGETARDEFGLPIVLRQGLLITAFDKDSDEDGNPDDLIANGVVSESPEWLRCNGSTWALQIDERGVYRESEISER